MLRLLMLLTLLPAFSFAQGISFEKGTWKSILAKAKKENKLVYMDVYTTWCGPCNVLAKTIFPKKEAGDKYNAAFVNYRVDAERGEGITLNKKYGVNGYPTHLFIDPKTEEVVYKTEGAPREVARFNEDADVALSEWKDPMTWARYEKEFAAGNRNPEFLKAYLRKAEKLDKPNEKILDAYVGTLDIANLPDSMLYFLAVNTKTIWTKALPVLDQNNTRLEKVDTVLRYYGYEHQMERLPYESFERVVAAKDENKLAQLLDFVRARDKEEPENLVYYFRKRYWEETKVPAKLKQVRLEEAAWILQKPLSDYKEGDAKARKNMEAQVRYQLTAMTLSDSDNVDSIVAYNVRRNVGGHPSVYAAKKLNELAWSTYEDEKATSADLQQALMWSEKAMELTVPHPEEWAKNADTHAALLYRTGKRKDAVALETSAVKALKDAKSEDIASYEKTLQKMKAGTF